MKIRRLFADKKSLIKKFMAIASVNFLAGSVYALSPAVDENGNRISTDAPRFTVNDGKILDYNGKPFVFRGVTLEHNQDLPKTLQALKDIAALGANSAQIEFPSRYYGVHPLPVIADLRAIIAGCKDNKLVCVLEPNDIAGFRDVTGSEEKHAASFWYQGELRPVLQGMEGHIILGIGNQLFGSHNDTYTFALYTRDVMSRIFSLYPTFTLMADGNLWGQDPRNAHHQLAFLNLASGGVFKNVVYSVEMFDQYQSPEQVRNYISSLTAYGVPVVIGGFAPTPYYHPNFRGPVPLNAPRLPAQAVMQYAQEYGAGYFGWSWSGNKNPALDVAYDWNPNSLTEWGNLLFNDVNGIRATAETASIFASSSSASSVPTNRPPIAVISDAAIEYVRCGEVYGKVSALRSTDPDGDALTYQWIRPGKLNSTSTDPEFRYLIGVPDVDDNVTLQVSDGRGGLSRATAVLKHSYSNECPSSSAASSTQISRSSSSIKSSASSSPASSSNVSSLANSLRPLSSSTSSRFASSSSLSSSLRPSSSSQPSTFSSSSKAGSSAPSSASAIGTCTYVVNSQWNNGFTATIRIKNLGAHPVNGWSVSWQYQDGSKVSGSWNTSLSGTNPYTAKNVSWNATIQPGKTVEFGFQGNKPAGAAAIPTVSGSVCR